MTVGTSDIDLITKRDVYPTYFQLDSSAFDFLDARVELIITYGWKKVGLLFNPEENYYVEV